MLGFSGLIIYLLPPLFKFNTVSLSALFVANKVIVFLIVNSITAVNVMFITSKYEDYDGIVFNVDKNVRSKIRVVPRYILILLIIVTLLLQGFGA